MLPPATDETSTPDDRLICVQPPSDHVHGTLPLPSLPQASPSRATNTANPNAEHGWAFFAGVDAAEALAAALDSRGWHERKLQAALWARCETSPRPTSTTRTRTLTSRPHLNPRCNEWLFEAYGMRELDCRTVADETLPPFEPEARPIAVQTHASQPHRAAREERFELAESIPGAMSEEQTDAKLYPGAYAKGWRVFAKDDQGHFHYRISTYRFTNRREALLFDADPNDDNAAPSRPRRAAAGGG